MSDWRSRAVPVDTQAKPEQSGWRSRAVPVEHSRSSAAVNEDNDVGEGEAALRGAGQGVTLGFGDELAGGVGALLKTAQDGNPSLKKLGDNYGIVRDSLRRDNARAHEKQPEMYTGGEIVGGAAIPVPGGASKTVGGAIAKGAATGGVLGGVSGLGTSEAKDVKGMLSDAKNGAEFGAAGGALFGGLAQAGANAGERAADKAAAKAEQSLKEAIQAGDQPLIDKYTKELATFNTKKLKHETSESEAVKDSNFAQQKWAAKKDQHELAQDQKAQFADYVKRQAEAAKADEPFKYGLNLEKGVAWKEDRLDKVLKGMTKEAKDENARRIATAQGITVDPSASSGKVSKRLGELEKLKAERAQLEGQLGAHMGPQTSRPMSQVGRMSEDALAALPEHAKGRAKDIEQMNATNFADWAAEADKSGMSTPDFIKHMAQQEMNKKASSLDAAIEALSKGEANLSPLKKAAQSLPEGVDMLPMPNRQDALKHAKILDLPTRGEMRGMLNQHVENYPLPPEHQRIPFLEPKPAVHEPKPFDVAPPEAPNLPPAADRAQAQIAQGGKALAGSALRGLAAGATGIGTLGGFSGHTGAGVLGGAVAGTIAGTSKEVMTNPAAKAAFFQYLQKVSKGAGVAADRINPAISGGIGAVQHKKLMETDPEYQRMMQRQNNPGTTFSDDPK
jgi:hypothetical protein